MRERNPTLGGCDLALEVGKEGSGEQLLAEELGKAAGVGDEGGGEQRVAWKDEQLLAEVDDCL